MIKKENYTIDLIRILACLLIVWDHTSGFILDGAFNKLLWANIGVQIFFFMSGYLYSNKKIEHKVLWLRKQILKILIPCWIYLVIILPLIEVLNQGSVSVLKVCAAFAGIQGLCSASIEGIGQHWFISYILLCYLITPTVLKKTEKKFVNMGGIGYGLA